MKVESGNSGNPLIVKTPPQGESMHHGRAWSSYANLAAAGVAGLTVLGIGSYVYLNRFSLTGNNGNLSSQIQESECDSEILTCGEFEAYCHRINELEYENCQLVQTNTRLKARCSQIENNPAQVLNDEYNQEQHLTNEQNFPSDLPKKDVLPLETKKIQHTKEKTTECVKQILSCDNEDNVCESLNKVNESEYKICQLRSQIDEIKTWTDEHQSGYEEVTIWKFNPKEEDPILYCSSNTEHERKYHEYTRTYEEAEIVTYDSSCPLGWTKKDDGVLKDFKGELLVTAEIDSVYCLEKTCKNERKSFKDERTMKQGKFCELDDIIKTEGWKNQYIFNAHWSKDHDRPWIKIVHRLPKAKYYEKDLIDKFKEISVLEGKRDEEKKVLELANATYENFKAQKDLHTKNV